MLYTMSMYISATPVMTLDSDTVNTAVVVKATVTFTCGETGAASEWFYEGDSIYSSSEATYTFEYADDKQGVYSCKNGNSETSNFITLATGISFRILSSFTYNNEHNL